MNRFWVAAFLLTPNGSIAGADDDIMLADRIQPLMDEYKKYFQ